MLGFPTDKGTIDARAGFLATQLRDTLEDIEHVKAWLDAKPDNELEALGYTAGEVAVLKSAFTQMAEVSDLANGRATLPVAEDLMVFARQLTGLN